MSPRYLDRAAVRELDAAATKVNLVHGYGDSGRFGGRSHCPRYGDGIAPRCSSGITPTTPTARCSM
jgi:hypothetical protein